MTEFTVHATTGSWLSPIALVYRLRAIDSVAAADSIRSLWYRSGQTDEIYIGEIVRTMPAA